MRTWISALLVIVSVCAVNCGRETEIGVHQTRVAEPIQATLTACAGSAAPPPTCPETAQPWDTSWLPSERHEVARRIDEILEGSGLADQGTLIVDLAIEYGVNPAFALAMFEKEASFARQGTRAQRNNNPGNIIATGDCRGRQAGQECSGHYGEISTDGRFGVYPRMAHGIEAYFRLLASEYKPGTARDCGSIGCVVSAYCPPAECDTDQYVAQIADWSHGYQCDLLGAPRPAAVLAPKATPLGVAVTVIPATVSPVAVKESTRDQSSFGIGEVFEFGGGWADGLLAAVLGWDFVDHAGYSRPRIAVDMAVANEATHTIPLVVVLKQPDFWLVSQDGERTLAQHGYSGGIEWCQGSYLGPREAVVCSYEFSLSGHAANALIVFQPLSVSETVSVDLGPEPISAAMPFEDRADIRTPSLGQPVDFDTGLTVTLHNASATALGQAAEELGIVVLDDHGFVEITLTLENTGSDTLQLTAFANEDPILVKDPLTTREYPSLRPDMVLPGFLDPGEMVTTRAVFQVPKEADTLVLKLVYSFTGRDWSTAFLMLPD